MMDEDAMLGPKGWGSMECEAAWRQWVGGGGGGVTKERIESYCKS